MINFFIDSNKFFFIFDLIYTCLYFFSIHAASDTLSYSFATIYTHFLSPCLLITGLITSFEEIFIFERNKNSPKLWLGELWLGELWLGELELHSDFIVPSVLCVVVSPQKMTKCIAFEFFVTIADSKVEVFYSANSLK